MEQRELIVGGLYRHFKNKLYQVKCIAYHSETKQKMVVYQALYGDYSVYVRPYDMFMSEVDHEKYPDIYQKYRFEQVQPDGSMMPHRTAQQPGSVEQVQQSIHTCQHNNTQELDDKHMQHSNTQQQDNTSMQDGVISGIEEARQSIQLAELHEDSISCDEGEVDERLMMFLDSETYQEKLNTLTGLRSKLDDKLIDSMAASLEIEVPEGPIDKRYASLRSCIMTYAKFECTRLRE